MASNGETLEIKGFEKEIFQKKGKLFKRTGVAKFKLFNNKKLQNFSFSKELVLQNVNFQKNWCCKV